MHDVVIKNGTVVDGTGRSGYRGDVAVDDGIITEVGEVTDSSTQVIDASDLVVAPGFVDPHTHYDAQVCWDPMLTSSSWHGVTSIVMGNCGVGIAPCRPETQEIATRDLVTVEGIPFDVLEAGITWDWQSFPEYMDATVARRIGINVGFLAPLTPLRHYVMDEESMQRPATSEEASEIALLLKQAIAAGALGFSTTTLPQHVGYKGLPLACRQASLDELKAYAKALKELDKGCIEISLTSEMSVVSEHEYELLDMLLTASGRPVTWLALLDRLDKPDACQSSLAFTSPLNDRGAVPQVSPRPMTLAIDLRKPWIFRGMTCWSLGPDATAEQIMAAYRDPDFRAAFRKDLQSPHLFTGQWDRAWIQQVGDRDQEEKMFGTTVAQIAQERGHDPLDTFFDLALEHGLDLVYGYEALNTDNGRVGKLLTDSATLIGLSDGGAHVDMLCDAGYATYVLGQWVRERGVLTLEDAVRQLTLQPAQFFGLADRGRLAAGMAADIVVFDQDSIGSAERPEWRRDLPGGGRRFVMRAQGVHHTIVNGISLLQDGEHTGALPGQRLRAA